MTQETQEYDYSNTTSVDLIIGKLRANGLTRHITAIANAIRSLIKDDGDLTYVTKAGEEKSSEHKLEVYDFLQTTDFVPWLETVTATIIAHDKGLGRTTTHQNVVSILYPKMEELSTEHRKFLAIQVLLEGMAEYCGMVSIVPGENNSPVWESRANLPDELLTDLNNRAFPLPSVDPLQCVVDRDTLGYVSLTGNVMTGCAGKRHDRNLSLDHINRKNSVRYALDKRLPFIRQPEFNEEAQLKSDGTLETPLNIQDRKASFWQLFTELPNRMDVLASDKFHLAHRYDNRGRTYCYAYHFSYQGNKYMKAMIKLDDSRELTGSW